MQSQLYPTWMDHYLESYLSYYLNLVKYQIKELLQIAMNPFLVNYLARGTFSFFYEAQVLLNIKIFISV